MASLLWNPGFFCTKSVDNWMNHGLKNSKRLVAQVSIFGDGLKIQTPVLKLAGVLGFSEAGRDLEFHHEIHVGKQWTITTT